MNETLLLILIKSQNAIAGILGGLVAGLTDNTLGWRDYAILMIIGGISSFYLIPALESYLHLSQQISSFLAFCFGMIAKSFIVQAKEKYTKILVNKGEKLL